ncbi:MAG: AAA family ATPase [Proteobacteria bacterium]|nr:AAA family ATPase [Pseudomonadota bacterium]
MSMLQYFFTIPVKEDGSIHLEEREKRYTIFEKMKIGAHKEILDKYLGQYPVIFACFKDIKGLTYDELEMGIRDVIYKLYISHEYLLQSKKLSDIKKEHFRKFITKKFDLSELKDSLLFLSELLFIHFEKKVILLIDEYDTPMNDWYAKQLAREEDPSEVDKLYLQNILLLFGGIFSKALKGNDYLEKGVVTGILRVAKANLFSGLNNLGEDSVLDKTYAADFGFTENEVDVLLQKTSLDQSLQISNGMRSWYNGYTVGGLTIYNPWSIMNCLNNGGEFKAYWVGTASTALIEGALILDKFQDEIQILGEGGSIEIIADPKMAFSNIRSSPNALNGLLLFSGYLTAKRVENAKGGMYRCDVCIPNTEVLEVFETSAMNWISQKFKIEINEYNAFITELLKGNIETFSKKLKDYLSISASFYMSGPKNAELFYNGFILGLISAVSSHYFVETEKKSGEGRADLILIPKPTARYKNALILEFKFSKMQENLTSLAEKALHQIEAKKYETKIKADPLVEKIFKVGLAFQGKEVAVAFKESASTSILK